MISFINSEILQAKKEHAHCSMDMTPQWHELDTSNRFDSKWVIAGTLSIKKRMVHTLRIESMTLAWHGPEITNLKCSLFKMPYEKIDTFATDENLISQGTWSKKYQRIHLKFTTPEYINDPVAFYGLVMTFDTATEQLLKQGYFEMVPDSLPDQLQKSVQGSPLKLSFIER